MPTNVSLTRLRRATLHHQGLTRAAPFGTAKSATLKAIEHLGYVQIDTLAVVERAHHHILWTRIPTYKPVHLERLLQERKVFEYWSHAAAFLPMRDYRFALPRMNAVKRGESKWFAKVPLKDEQQVLQRIRTDGPLRARDFDSAKKQSGSWWNWKPAKMTLEKLFFQGDLMIAGREGMQKVYDLRERVLPEHVDTREPTLQEFAEHLIDTALNAHGFITQKQIVHQRKGVELRAIINTLLRIRVHDGDLALFTIDDSMKVYGKPDLFERRWAKPARAVQILSPFDNAVIHRDRVKSLFDFDYTIECYTPQHKRRYGYFTLPLLFGEHLVGRMDCKADRAARRLEVLSLHMETPAYDTDEFHAALTVALQCFAIFNGCEEIAQSQRRTVVQ